MIPSPALKEPVKVSHVKSIPLIRIASIDIVRALTMVLMIFVNDLGTLKNIPAWLEHVKPGVDGIGLSDVVFPAFLFIVGLSLPFAMENRRKKGDTELQLVMHVLLRTIALLVMGVFLVNGETINEAATGMPGDQGATFDNARHDAESVAWREPRSSRHRPTERMLLTQLSHQVS